MKMYWNKIAAVALITSAAFAQSSQQSSTQNSASDAKQLKATPVQIKPKAKPASTLTVKPVPADKSKATAQSTTKPVTTKQASSTVKPASSQTATKPKALKANGPKPVTAAVSSQKSPASASAKPGVTASQGNKTAAKPASISASPGAKSASSVQKPALKIVPSKSASSVPTQKPAAAASASKVAAKPVAKGTQITSKPAVSAGKTAAKPAKAASTTTQPNKAAPNTKLSAVEKPDAETQEAATPAPKKFERGRRRDPFISPIQTAHGTGPSSSCTSGKRCLDIDQVILKGIVRTREGNMALVENGAKRPYVLRENDSLFNGTVEKITGDSIFFRQTVQDVVGHTSTREVVKRVTAPSV